MTRKTTIVSVRVDLELKNALSRIAHNHALSVSDLINRMVNDLIRSYAKGHRPAYLRKHKRLKFSE